MHSITPFFITTALTLAGGQSPSDTVPFKQPIDISRGGVSGVSSMDVADISGNGRGDVAVIEGGKHAGGRRTFAWFEAGGGLSDPWVRHEFNARAELRSFLGAARLADMDGDGDSDLVVSSDNHSGANKQADILVFLNPRPHRNAGESWSPVFVARDLSLHHINDLEVADLDRDGLSDLVARSLEPNQVHLFFNDGSEAYSHRIIDTGLERSEGLAVADLNGDQLPEICFTGFLLRAPGSPRIEAYERIEIDPDYHEVNQNTKEALGDLDGDGWADLVLAPAEAYRDGKPHALAWYRNPKGELDAPWTQRVVRSRINNLHTIKLGDMDGDGFLDIVTGQPWGDAEVRIYYNDGAGGFQRQQVVTSGKGLYSGVLADLDGDGDLDIVGQDRYAKESRPYVYESLLNAVE